MQLQLKANRLEKFIPIEGLTRGRHCKKNREGQVARGLTTFHSLNYTALRPGFQYDRRSPGRCRAPWKSPRPCAFIFSYLVCVDRGNAGPCRRPWPRRCPQAAAVRAGLELSEDAQHVEKQLPAAVAHVDSCFGCSVALSEAQTFT
jgi:hypothetical protein